MQITFRGYAPTERSITVDESDLAVLSDLMRTKFLETIEYGSFDKTYIGSTEKQLLELCAQFGVDGTYAPDRLAFFRALLGVTSND